MMPEKKGRGWIVWVVVIVLVVLAAILIFSQGPAMAPGPEIGTGDTTSAIDAQLGSIDLGDLEAELGDIDADLNQL